MEKAAEFGAPSIYLDEDAMRARGIPPVFLSGYATGGGTLDPGKYVMGLRRAALAAGVRLYEGTPLVSFEQSGKTILCKTPRGQVSAPVAVFATNAFTPQLGLLEKKSGTVRVSGIETEPLSGAQLQSLGWPNREGITTQHNIMESHRLTARNTLVLTTKTLQYIRGKRTPNAPYEPAYKALAGALRDRFPTLRDLGIRYCWSGYISMARDVMPIVGTTGAHQNIYFSAGCFGHGVGTQSFMGKLLADQIGGLNNEYYTALRHEAPSKLPDMLEWAFMSSAFKMATLLDNRTNRQLR
jgi:glycine/D-amino acid oxidase-like deaminating enzyme